MLKDTGASVLKKKGLQENFSGDLKKKKNKKKGLQENFSCDLPKQENKKSLREYSARFLAFSNYILTVQKKNSAVLEPRTEKFSRT